MKTLLPLVLSVVFCLSARADLAIYNFTGTLTVAGSGFVTVARPKGVLLWDVDTGQAWQLAVFTVFGTKRLVVVDQSESRLFQSQSATKTYTAVLGHTVTNTGALTAESFSFTFGVNSELPLRPGRTISLPRTAKNTGFALTQVNASGVTLMGPATGMYSFSAKQSATANNAGQSLDAALQQFRAKYQALGYVE